MIEPRVIHWGVDVVRFAYRPSTPEPPRRLLYVGQVVPHKGIHTAIEAVRLLRDDHACDSVRLDIVGGSVQPSYVESLRGLVAKHGLVDVVRFLGPVPREDLPLIYREHDIAIFPVIWEEPFSITLLEAMASGLMIVSTLTGGTPEVVEPGINALTFHCGDAHECAWQIHRLLLDRDLCERIRQNARRTVEQRFRLDDMAARIADDLVASLRCGEDAAIIAAEV